MWHGGSVELPCDIPLEELLDIKSDRDLAKYPIPDKPISAPTGKAKTALYESIDRHLYLPAAKMSSFRLNPGRRNIESWICALTARYYNCIGNLEGWSCEWVNMTDPDTDGSSDIEHVSCIKIKVDHGDDTLFTVRLFLKTHLITVQGNKHVQWCDFEFPVLKQAVDILMRTDSSVVDVDETNLKQIVESVEDPVMPPGCPDIQGEDCVEKEKSTSEATDNPTKPKSGNKSLPKSRTVPDTEFVTSTMLNLQSSIDIIQNRLSVLENSIIAVKEFCSNTSYDLKIDNLNDSFCKLDKKIDSLAHSVKAAPVQQSCKSCDFCKTQLSQAQSEINDLKTKLASSESEKSLLNSRLTELSDSISDLKRRNDILSTELKLSKSDSVRLSADLENAQKEKSTAERCYHECHARMDEKSEMINRLQDQILTLRHAYQQENPWTLQAQSRVTSSGEEKKSVIFFSDSIGKGIDVSRLAQGSRLNPDNCVKKTTSTIQALMTEAEKIHSSEIIITHVGVNDMKLSNFISVDTHVEDYVSVITKLTEKCDKLIVSLITPSEVQDDANLFFRSNDFNNRLSQELKDKPRVILSDNSNFSHRGEIIQKLFDGDHLHLSQEGCAVFAANLKQSIRIATEVHISGSDSISTGPSRQSRSSNGPRGRGRGRGNSRRPYKSRDRSYRGDSDGAKGSQNDKDPNKLVAQLKNLLSDF